MLDLSRPIQAKSFLAAPNNRYGYRLVIDLGLSQSVDTPVKAEHAPRMPAISSSLSTRPRR